MDLKRTPLIHHIIAIEAEEEAKVGQTNGKVEEITSVGEMKEIETEEETNPPPSTSKNPSDNRPKDELYRSLAITRSKICKRNVVSHEVSAGTPLFAPASSIRLLGQRIIAPL